MSPSNQPPQPATPLIDLEAVVLDTETTGLDVRNDRVVQIGAVRLKGTELIAGSEFETLVRPGIPVPPMATRVHGLDDRALAEAPDFAAIAPKLAVLLDDAVVIGHSIHFDLAILRFEAVRHKQRWTEPIALDLGLLFAGLRPGLVDTSLDALLLSYGLKAEGRHSALGDARLTARLYAALLPELLAAGVRTLGEALSLCERPRELVARQEAAGWFDRPESRPDFSAAGLRRGVRQAVDGFLYRHRLGEVQSRPPLSIPAQASLQEAARLMHQHKVGCLIVTETENGMPGILTERDLTAALAEWGGEAAQHRVAERMSQPVITAPEDLLLYRVLGRMARHNLRHIAVTGRDGEITGVFSVRTLLRNRALSSLILGDEIAEARNSAALARVFAALPSLARGLLEQGFVAADVVRVIAAETRAMTARAAELALDALAEQGLGPAPAPFALLILGSGGREESLLAPDQDNALLIDDTYAGDLDSPNDWFTRFAERLTAILDEGGIPFCKGGVMARNRAWRRRRAEWISQIAAWAATPRPEALMNADIFFDFAPVFVSDAKGQRLAVALDEEARAIARQELPFLRALGEAAASRGTPLTFLGRLRTDDQGRVDLKAGGLFPLVAGARVVALRYGIASRSTPERLSAAVKAANRGEADAARLTAIHAFLTELILAQQIDDLEAGIRPSNRVNVRRLEAQKKAQLKDALAQVAALDSFVRDLLSAS